MDSNKKIKVCEVAPFGFKTVGGIERYLQGLNPELIERGAEIHVAYFTSDKRDKPEKISDSYYTHPIFNESLFSKNTTDCLKLYQKIKEIGRNYGLDVLHLHTSHTPQFVAACNAAREGKPFIITNHESGKITEKYGTLGSMLNLLFEYAFKKAIRTSVSNAAGEIYGSESFLNIGSFVDTEFFNPDLFDRVLLRKEYGLNDSFVAVYPSRVGPDKNQLDAIKAVQEVAKNLKPGKKVMLFIMGCDDRNKDYQDLLKKYVDENNLNTSVRLLPALPREDVRKWYAIADALVFPTLHREGFPLCALEAGAMGIPVIAYDSGGINELVKNNETGFLISKGDYSGMAHMINLLIENPALGKWLGKNGERFSRIFSKEKLADIIMTVYQNALMRNK